MSDTTQFCTFGVDDLWFGVDVTRVQEVIRYQEMTRVPLAPRTVRGLINLRGQIVMAVDLRERLGLPARSDEDLPMNVVIHGPSGPISLLVDRIGDVIEVSGDCFEVPPSTMLAAHRQLVDAVCKLPGQLLLVMDPERAFMLAADSQPSSNGQAARS